MRLGQPQGVRSWKTARVRLGLSLRGIQVPTWDDDMDDELVVS